MEHANIADEDWTVEKSQGGETVIARPQDIDEASILVTGEDAPEVALHIVAGHRLHQVAPAILDILRVIATPPAAAREEGGAAAGGHAHRAGQLARRLEDILDAPPGETGGAPVPPPEGAGGIVIVHMSGGLVQGVHRDDGCPVWYRALDHDCGLDTSCHDTGPQRDSHPCPFSHEEDGEAPAALTEPAPTKNPSPATDAEARLALSVGVACEGPGNGEPCPRRRNATDWHLPPDEEPALRESDKRRRIYACDDCAPPPADEEDAEESEVEAEEVDRTVDDSPGERPDIPHAPWCAYRLGGECTCKKDDIPPGEAAPWETP